MKWIALILAIMITVPPMASTVSYLFGDEGIMLDGSLGEEEKEERESNEGEEKDKELNLEEEKYNNNLLLQTTSFNTYLECTLLSQNHTKDFSPPPEV